MSRLGIFRRWRRWAVVEAVELFWDCRCTYHNAATYRCYFCGKRMPLPRLAPEPIRPAGVPATDAAHHCEDMAASQTG
jgi:hypothetical protein